MLPAAVGDELPVCVDWLPLPVVDPEVVADWLPLVADPAAEADEATEPDEVDEQDGEVLTLMFWSLQRLTAKLVVAK